MGRAAVARQFPTGDWPPRAGPPQLPLRVLELAMASTVCRRAPPAGTIMVRCCSQELGSGNSVKTAHARSSGSWRGPAMVAPAAPCLPLDPARHATTRSLAAGGNRSHGPALRSARAAMPGTEQGSGRWQISGTWTWPDRLSDPTDSTVVKELLDRSRSQNPPVMLQERHPHRRVRRR